MRKLLLIAVLALLASCSTSIDSYRDQTPTFALEQFFNGKLRAYGMVQDYNDKVTRRFSVDLIGRWNGNEGVLEEDFYYADGETQRRVWYLTKLNDGRYSGRADDVIGTALGSVEGFALNWHYTLQVPIDGDIMEFQLDDWMYLVSDNHLLNRATMKKFGLPVAEITLYIEKLDD
jgi:hypothetical protein